MCRLPDLAAVRRGHCRRRRQCSLSIRQQSCSPHTHMGSNLPADLPTALQVQNLSGGELQRVAITMALGMPADIYLIDEPSAYLDSEQRIVAAKASSYVLLAGLRLLLETCQLTFASLTSPQLAPSLPDEPSACLDLEQRIIAAKANAVSWPPVVATLC